jgi:hypothetical protein
MEDYIKKINIRSEYGILMEHEKWIKEIPYLDFPKEWKIQISPPFAGAVVRFRVKYKEADISVYLDCYDNLGCFGAPYWEVYPYDNDVYRCEMKNTEELIRVIQESINLLT